MSNVLRIAIVMTLALALGLAAGCGPSAEDEARTAFDESIHGVKDAIAGYYVLGPDVPAEAAGIGVGRITDAWLLTVSAAEGVEGADLSGAQAAYDALATATESLNEDDPKPMDTLMPLVQAFEAEIDELHAAGDFH